MEKHFNLFQFINLVRTTIFHYNSTLISYVIKKKKIKTTRIHLISDALHLINIDRVWRNAFQSAKCATGVLEMSFFPPCKVVENENPKSIIAENWTRSGKPPFTARMTANQIKQP